MASVNIYSQRNFDGIISKVVTKPHEVDLSSVAFKISRGHGRYIGPSQSKYTMFIEDAFMLMAGQCACYVSAVKSGTDVEQAQALADIAISCLDLLGFETIRVGADLLKGVGNRTGIYKDDTNSYHAVSDLFQLFGDTCLLFRKTHKVNSTALVDMIDILRYISMANGEDLLNQVMIKLQKNMVRTTPGTAYGRAKALIPNGKV